MSILQEYSDLVDLAKKSLQEESATWLFADNESYHYFKAYALQKKPPKNALEAASKQKPLPQVQPPLPQVMAKPAPAVIKAVPATVTLLPEIKKEEVVVKQEEKKLLENSKETSKQFFQLSPLKKATPHDLSDVKKIIQSLFPNTILLEKPIKIEPEALILFKEIREKEKAFLLNLEKALQFFMRTKLLPLHKFQAQESYPNLKVIVLAEDVTITKNEKIRYFVLPPIKECLQNPNAKKILWETVKNGFY